MALLQHLRIVICSCHSIVKSSHSTTIDEKNGKFTVFVKKRDSTDKEYRNGRCKWAPVVVKHAIKSGWQAVALAYQIQQIQAQQEERAFSCSINVRSERGRDYLWCVADFSRLGTIGILQLLPGLFCLLVRSAWS
ncbi:hypothetical protein QBC32DRAFT_319760 [Pseudoneurospora amorphoporcata]|uniref:Uncharacterized protein n=1 Tax=Pseudoneurospora amorphoporcata TaxID=241081 RepID=A0AAN6NIX5_9PEZI|nr:hypothetical protein QBC32DRAFT_319760 [Pseudoneurospora amorphoporcata]